MRQAGALRVKGDREAELALPRVGLIVTWTDPSDPWLRRAIETTAAITGANAVMGAVPFNTDGSFLAPAYGGIPTLILGPGDPAQAHKTDEWCSVAKIDEATAIYLELMRRF